MAPAQAPASASKPKPRQHTLAGPVRVRGNGLLSGVDADLEILPAPAGHGIVFERSDLDPPVRIPARVENVVVRPRRTVIKSGDASIETVEHCMSALAGLRVDNALLRLHGPELPAGDGSALPFAEPMLAAGIIAQDAERIIHRLRAPALCEDPDGAMIAAFPSDGELMRVVFDLDYGKNAHRIGRQGWSFDLATGDYMREVAPSRTFSLKEEAEALLAAGLCTHLTPRDVLVIGEDGPIDNAFRFDNEPVRHKVLDAIGDLYLIGAPVQCRVLASRAGHGLNRRLGLEIVQRIKAANQAASLGTGRAMDARAISRLLPHRYPMLLVDRVLELDGSRRAVGVKNVTMNEPFFPGHYPGQPIMPGVLIVEAMAQLSGLLLAQTLEHTGKVAVLLSLDGVKLRRQVSPGDQLVMEAETVTANSRSATVQCRASVAGMTAAVAKIRFMMVDADAEIE